MNSNSDVLSIIKHNIENCTFIAAERNRILNLRHGTIPSYSLWDSDSVAAETLEERLEWFEHFLEELHYFYFYSPISQRRIGQDANKT